MIKFISIIALLWATSSVAQTADIVIEGRIGQNMAKASEALVKVAAKQDKVNIVIDSPGGSVYAGWTFIRTLRQVQARGVTVDCYVSGMAASMAFQILSFCDGKYSLSYALLLWHPVRATVPEGITPRFARLLAKDLRDMEKQLVKELRNNLTFDDDFFSYHYIQETLHLATTLRDEVPGIKLVETVPKSDKDTVVAADRGMFFTLGSMDYANPTALRIFYGLRQ